MFGQKKEKKYLFESFAIETPQITLQGNHEAVIEGCKKILLYDENVIQLIAGKRELRFYGKNLAIKCLTAEKVIIKGEFNKIEYIR